MPKRIGQSQTCQNKGYFLAEAIVLTGWMAAITMVNYLMLPAKRGFHCDDESISYPYLASTVSGSAIVALTLGVPAVMLCAIELLLRITTALTTTPDTGNDNSGRTPPRWWVRVGSAYVVYFFAWLTVTLTVVVLKAATGQYRPHFLDVCKPDVMMSNCNSSSSSNHVYISEYNCTNSEVDEKKLLDARKSFPSGHAAYAFLTAVYLIIYVEKRVVTRYLLFLKLSLYAVLILYGVWVSATRVIDHMHHVVDVIFGALLGVVFALGSFYGSAYYINCCADPNPYTVNLGTASSNLASNNHDLLDNINMNNNSNRGSRSDEEAENGTLDPLEIETPTTPPRCSSTGFRFPPTPA